MLALFFEWSLDCEQCCFRFGNEFLYSRVQSLAPRPTPNPEDQVLLLVCPLPCNLLGLAGPARSLSP